MAWRIGLLALCSGKLSKASNDKGYILMAQVTRSCRFNVDGLVIVSSIVSQSKSIFQSRDTMVFEIKDKTIFRVVVKWYLKLEVTW